MGRPHVGSVLDQVHVGPGGAVSGEHVCGFGGGVGHGGGLSSSGNPVRALSVLFNN